MDLEFRKTLVQSVAEKAAEKLLASGMSASEILAKAFSEDLTKLMGSDSVDNNDKLSDARSDEKMLKACSKRLGKSKDNSEVDDVIAGLLESDE